MIPARIFLRPDHDAWLDTESLARGGNQRSAIVRLAVDRLQNTVGQLGDQWLTEQLKRREERGS
jgi:hypothetical protein